MSAFSMAGSSDQRWSVTMAARSLSAWKAGSPAGARVSAYSMTTAVRWRLRVFRLVYALTAASMAPRALAGWLRRRRQVGEGFSGDTLQGRNP